MEIRALNRYLIFIIERESNILVLVLNADVIGMEIIQTVLLKVCKFLQNYCHSRQLKLVTIIF